MKLNPLAYEHIRPEQVGNFRNIPVSDLSGKSNIFLLAQALGLNPGEHDAAVREAAEKIKELLQDRHHLKENDVLQIILSKVKELESQGYTFEEADGSLKLLMYASLGKGTEFFRMLSYRVVDQITGEDEAPVPEATLRVRVGLNEVHTAALGNGPVDALYNALLKALIRFFPRLVEMRLEDYKVRVLPGTTGSTAAKVRVLIESRDAHDRWGTVGVSMTSSTLPGRHWWTALITSSIKMNMRQWNRVKKRIRNLWSTVSNEILGWFYDRPNFSGKRR